MKDLSPLTDLSVKRTSAGTFCDVFLGTWTFGPHVFPIIVKLCHKETWKPEIMDKLLDLRHPNLERIYTWYEAEPNTILVFSEPLKITFSHYDLRQPGAVSVLNLATDILTGLDYLHNKLKIIHGDIKDNNLMLSHDNVGKIIDFNGCRPIEEFDQYPLPVIAGNIHPHALFEPNKWGYEQDLWALAVTFYRMVFRTDLACKFLKKMRLDENLDVNDLPHKYKRCYHDFCLQQINKCLGHEVHDPTPPESNFVLTTALDVIGFLLAASLVYRFPASQYFCECMRNFLKKNHKNFMHVIDDVKKIIGD